MLLLAVRYRHHASRRIDAVEHPPRTEIDNAPPSIAVSLGSRIRCTYSHTPPHIHHHTHLRTHTHRLGHPEKGANMSGCHASDSAILVVCSEKA